MGVYSNKQILQAIADGHIVCHPFDAKHVSQASLDVTLGYYYYKTAPASDRTVYNPFDHTDVERYFGGPYRAISHKQWADQNGYQLFAGIPEDHPVIALGPGERILAHTHEFFGIVPPGAVQIKSRSTWARSGLAVCFDAGWVDPGYINRLTLQIYNLNQHETLLLPVGERIAQAVFLETGEVEGSYGQARDGGFSGKYQNGNDLDTIIKTWSPDLMLPQAYKDQRTLPVKIEGISYE